MGYIYILTNPSFKEWVKIGYATDVDNRLHQLNRSECTPFSFRVYATYETSSALADKDVHELIDMFAPQLRSVETDGTRVTRRREFYNMTPEQAFKILYLVSKINGMKPPVLVEPTKKDIENEDEATESRTRKKATQYPKMDWMMKEGLIKKGDRICVLCKPDEIAVVEDEDTVIYKGEPMSFNHFGLKVTGWKAIQTYAYMKIANQEETLADLREKRMIELGMMMD